MARRPWPARCRSSRLSPIRVFATGGIGGVHRESQFDESADLAELARTPVIVVCAGAKSILDLTRDDGAARVARCRGGRISHQRDARLLLRRHRHSALNMPSRPSTRSRQLFALHCSLGRQQAIVIMQPPPAEHALRKATHRTSARHGARRCTATRRARRCGDAISPHGRRTSERGPNGRREHCLARSECGAWPARSLWRAPADKKADPISSFSARHVTLSRQTSGCARATSRSVNLS